MPLALIVPRGSAAAAQLPGAVAPELSGRPAERYDHASMAPIRVALAEDNVLLREGISRLVDAADGLDVVGVAADLPQLLDIVRERAPDVVVTDIRMPPTGTDEGIRAATWIREHHPGTGVVVLSQFIAPGYALALLKHGSAGRAYLRKERAAPPRPGRARPWPGRSARRSAPW